LVEEGAEEMMSEAGAKWEARVRSGVKNVGESERTEAFFGRSIREEAVWIGLIRYSLCTDSISDGIDAEATAHELDARGDNGVE
jgi:hypothetical protein